MLNIPNRARRFANVVQKEFLTDYIASHTNAGNFLIGICLAMIYIQYVRSKKDILVNKVGIKIKQTRET